VRPKVNKYLVVIAGPTAVGKTQIAIELAKRFQTVIVSADSRQLFREMNIGTAKPTQAELAAVPHYFINHASLDEPYSAGKYALECHTLLERLFEKHHIVFLVGGAGFYVRAVIEGFDKMPTVPLQIREKWERIQRDEGLHVLQDALRKADPEFSKLVDMKNHRRLVRALSLIDTSGKTVTELRKQARASLPFNVLKFFLNLPREELYARIHARVDAMIAAGLVDEVRSLLPYRDAQAMQTVGYKEVIEYLDGKCTLDEAIMKIKQHSCNYAKRQLTWFRNQGDWLEFNPPEAEEIAKYIVRCTEEWVNGLMG
jgi:tRNA dimethylallyltransferase